MSRPFPQEAYAARIAFMVELAEHLHAYGTTAPRLEASLEMAAQKLELECEPWTNPTGMVLSFSDPMRPPGDSDTTRVIRVPPGDNDLGRLCDVDRIVEDVIAGRIGLAEGHAALRALDRPLTRRQNLMQVLGFGLVAAGIGGLLRLPWLDIATTSMIGLVIGLLQVLARTRPRLREAGDAVSAMVAASIAILVAAYVAPINLNTVIISALIVLMPGLALTNAVNELTSQHLISGTARFAGAVATMIMLTVGTMVAMAAAGMVGIEPQVRAWRPQPEWVEWCALAVAAFAFGTESIPQVRPPDLFTQADGVISASVKLRGDTAEVTNTRKRDIDQAIQQRPHLLTAQGDLNADGAALTQLECGDALLRPGNHRLLAGNGTQVFDCEIECTGVFIGFPHPDIHDDLVNPWNLHDVVILEFVHHCRDDVFPVARL